MSPSSDSQHPPFKIHLAERVARLPQAYLFGRINALMYQKRRNGADVIDMGMGNPHDPPEDVVVDKLCEAARLPENHGYNPSIGILNLRREVASKYLRKHGVRLDPETQTIVCLGSKEGYSHACLSLLGPGDTAIIPAPSYPAHLYGVTLASGNAIALEIADPQRFLANVAYSCQHLFPRPKLVVVCFPHNPSAVTVDPEFYVELVALARKYGFMVISDMAYGDIGFDGYQPPSFLAAPGALDLGIEFTTMSKGYNMAGWRVGYACGNVDMLKALSTVKAYYDYGMFLPIQVAAIVALRQTDAAVEAQAKVYEARRNILVDGLRRLGWDITPPRAGMFVWAKIPERWMSQMDSMAFAMKLLEEADVVVSPGGGFGQAGEGYLRMALVENEARIRQAVRQIAKCLGTEPGAPALRPRETEVAG